MTSSIEDLHQQIEDLKDKNKQLQDQLHLLQRETKVDLEKGELSLSELIDINLIQQLMTQFYELTGYPIRIIDTKHNILVSTGWQPVCIKFYRVHEIACKLCHESDSYIQKHLQERKFAEYKCKNGLWDIAQPIIIEGKHMATIFLGQFFYDDEDIDWKFFRDQAKKYNFNVDSFTKAVKQVPRFTRKEIKQLMTYYAQLAQILSHQGYINLNHQKEIKRTKQNKIALKRSKNQLDSIIDAIPSPIFVKDLKGKIILCNDSFAQKLKMSTSDIIGKTDFDIIPLEFALHNQKKDQQLIDNPGKQIYTTDVKLADGSAHHVIFYKSSYHDEHNNIAGVTGVAIDITEHEQIKIELEIAKNRAEESDRLKSAFLANMSHEIRTPLNGILGFADMLKNPNLLEIKKNKFINIINSCGNQLLSLITDIIDISKIEAGQIDLHQEEIYLNDLFEDLYLLFKIKADNQGIILHTSKAFNRSKSKVKTDETKLKQILTNLLDNAFKFTSSGNIEFGYSVDGANYMFFVKDTGIGIPEKEQEFIFNRFYQIKQEEREHAGTGLGLAITKGFVEFMQGNIQVESIEGEGTQFTVSIPMQQHLSPHQTAPEITRTEAYDWRNVKILIAEDEETNYLYLEESLSKTGLKILWAKNGQIAEEMCRKNEDINLVLMDLKMPVLNGFEATKNIRKFRKDLPIIAQTAYAFSEDKQKALDSGCSDYISKPLQTKTLLKIIDSHLKS